MIRSPALVAAGAASAIGLVWFVFNSYSQQDSVTQRPDQRPTAAGVQQPDHPVDLLLALGIHDERQLVWNGQIRVLGGTVVGIDLVRGARNSTVEGAHFKVRAARQRRGRNARQPGGLAAAQLRVQLDAEPSAIVEVDTSRGRFSFAVSDVPLGQVRQFLDGNASVQRDAGATRLTTPDSEDDFPAVAKGADGTVWLAYVQYQGGPPLVAERVLSGQFDALIPKGHGDQIKLVRFDGNRWHPALDVTEPGLDIWRPATALDGHGNVWIVWAQKLDDDWEIMSRHYRPAAGQWSPIHRVTRSQGSDFHTVATADASGRLWVACQAWRDGNYDILLASARDDGTWREPKAISRSRANDWNPAIAADSKGTTYVAWDTYDRQNYDVQLCAIGPDGEGSYRAIADSHQFEARPSLLCDSAGRLWIAYEQGDPQWGKDYLSDNNYQKVGFDRNPGFALYVNRTVKVKCLVDGMLKQPAGDLERAFAGTLTRNKSIPRLGADAQGAIWLLVRHHPLAGGAGEAWHSYALRYDGRQWSEPRHLSGSANLLDNRPALVALDQGLLAVYSGDYRTRTQDRQQDDLFSSILRDDRDTFSPIFVDAEPPPEQQAKPVHPHELEDVARLRNFRAAVGGKQLRLLRGEFHRHTEYTSHRDQDGMLEDSWRYALDAGHLDWMGNGDHDNGFGDEYLWWQIQKISDLHHHPPRFTAAMTYERSLQYPNGHRNVMMPRRGVRPLPRGSLESSPEEGTVDTKILYAYLKHFGGICASHTSGTNMGTDWRDNDPEVEPVVEIYQGHRHNYEHFGAPRSATAETQIGGYQPAGFVWNALERGYRLGFQSSSDHVSTHMSYAIVLAEENSRQAIIDAFKQRHCYAATDNILLIVRSGEHVMGDALQTPDRPSLSIEAFGTAPIAKFHIIRDNKYIYSAEPNERRVQRTFTDMDAERGQTSYYYVRVEQADGNLAWASPMWITYAP